MQPRNEVELNAVVQSNQIARRERLLRQATAGTSGNWFWLVLGAEFVALSILVEWRGLAAIPAAFLMLAVHLSYIQGRLNAIAALLVEEAATRSNNGGV
jgi:hypothetical protein